MWCIHTAVLIWLLLGKNCFILYVRSDFHKTNSLSIAVHALVCSFHFRLMRRYFLGQVNLSISFRGPPFCVEMSPLWLKHMYSVCLHWHGGLCTCWSFQTMQQGFSLGGCICYKRYVISVVCIHYSLCGVSSASFLCQSEAVFFH